MHSRTSVPSETEPASLADLVADAVAVRDRLDLQPSLVELPEQRAVAIPDGAVAVVADLDAYGD